MSFNSLLIDECTVQEYADAAIDDYGVPGKTWTDFATDEPCRLVPATNREVQVGARVVIAEYLLFIDNIGVTEQMQVIMGAITYEILSVMIRKDGVNGHHQECLLRTVR